MRSRLFIVSMFVAAALGGCMADEAPAPEPTVADERSVEIDPVTVGEALAGTAQLPASCVTCDLTGVQFCGITTQHAFNRCFFKCEECIEILGHTECFYGTCSPDF